MRPQGTVSRRSTSHRRQVTKTIQVGAHLSHPEGIAIDPKRARAYVAIANDDQIARHQHQDPQRSNDALAFTPAGAPEPRRRRSRVTARRLRSALGRLRRGRRRGLLAFPPARLRPGAGRHACGARPSSSSAGFRSAPTRPPSRRAPMAGKLAWVSARGLGVGPNPNGPNPKSPTTATTTSTASSTCPRSCAASSGILQFPSDHRIRKLTPRPIARSDPVNEQNPPADTPIRGGGPIKHVFYIVKENRTYDQVLGDDPRGDGDPSLTLFGKSDHPEHCTRWRGGSRCSTTSTRTRRPRSTATTGPPRGPCRTTW